jgi:hypothetical protein
MKKIISKSYIESQFNSIRFDPKRLKSPQNNNQNDPRIKTFHQSFISAGLNTINSLSQSDAILLNEIQDQIRKKLRFFGVQVGF